jgi:uridine phosphorylase
MVFASRTSQDFITPQQVSELEAWTSKGVLNALSSLGIPENVCPVIE